MTTPTDQPQAATRRPMWPWIGGAVVVVAVAGGVVYSGRDDITPDLAASATAACTEEYVPAKLEAPSSAYFSNTAVDVVQRDGKEYLRVTGSVDSVGSGGVSVRAEYDCTVAPAGGDRWRLVDVTLS